MAAANYAMAKGERGRTAAVTAAAVEIYSMTNDEGALRQRRRRHWSTVHIGYKAGVTGLANIGLLSNMAL